MTTKVAQERIQTHAGMSVETVKRNGSEGQKLMVMLFDSNRDGILDKREAEHFNRYRFTTEEGKISMTNIENGDVLELKYDNFEEDVLHLYKGEPLNYPHDFTFKNKDGKSCYFSKLTRAAKTVIDMVTGKVTIEGAKPAGMRCPSNIYGRNIELTVKDSDVEEISITNSKLNLENTKDEGIIFDSATKVQTDEKSTIKADTDSKYEVVEK